MKMQLLAAAGLAALISIPVAAQAQPNAPARACLRFGEIYSWKALDNKTLIVEDNFHQKFKVALMGYCPNLTFKQRIGFRSPGSMELSCVSSGDDVEVRNFGSGGQRCPIRSIAGYTPAMEAADREAAAAKEQSSH
jgi:hypothetical protein